MYYSDWLFLLNKKMNFLKINNININYIDNFINRNILKYKYSRNLKLKYKDLMSLNNILLKILNYENIEYVSNFIYFCGLKFLVNKNVFIPRIETENIVFFLLNYINNNKIYKILELGSGIGNISLTLSKFINKSIIVGIDINLYSILISKLNILNLKLNNNKIDFFLNNWYNFYTDKKFDIIISNPPYININENILYNNILYENFNFIFSGKNGLKDILYIINNFYKYLNKNGILILEHSINDKDKIIKIFKKSNKYIKIKSLKDLNNFYRFTFGIKN